MEHLEQHTLIEVSQHGFLPEDHVCRICWHILRVRLNMLIVDYQSTLCVWTLLKRSITYRIEDY